MDKNSLFTYLSLSMIKLKSALSTTLYSAFNKEPISGTVQLLTLLLSAQMTYSVLCLQSASKLLRHSYPLESISSSVRKWPPPPHPRDNVVFFFLFPMSLVNSRTTFIRVGEGGVSGNVLFEHVFLQTVSLPVCSVGNCLNQCRSLYSKHQDSQILW